MSTETKSPMNYGSSNSSSSSSNSSSSSVINRILNSTNNPTVQDLTTQDATIQDTAKLYNTHLQAIDTKISKLTSELKSLKLERSSHVDKKLNLLKNSVDGNQLISKLLNSRLLEQSWVEFKFVDTSAPVKDLECKWSQEEKAYMLRFENFVNGFDHKFFVVTMAKSLLAKFECSRFNSKNCSPTMYFNREEWINALEWILSNQVATYNPMLKFDIDICFDEYSDEFEELLKEIKLYVESQGCNFNCNYIGMLTSQDYFQDVDVEFIGYQSKEGKEPNVRVSISNAEEDYCFFVASGLTKSKWYPFKGLGQCFDDDNGANIDLKSQPNPIPNKVKSVNDKTQKIQAFVKAGSRQMLDVFKDLCQSFSTCELNILQKAVKTYGEKHLNKVIEMYECLAKRYKMEFRCNLFNPDTGVKTTFLKKS